MASVQYIGLDTSIDVPVPTVSFGYLQDDILICILYVMWPGTYGTAGDFVAPAGWTEISQNRFNLVNTDVTQGDGMAAFVRTSNGTEPATYTFTWGGNAVGVARIVAYRGATASSTNGVVINPAGDPIIVTCTDTTTVANQRVVCAWAARTNGDPQFALPTNVRQRSQTPDGDNFGCYNDEGRGVGTSSYGRLDVGEALIAAAGPVSELAAITPDGTIDPADQKGMGICVVLNT